MNRSRTLDLKKKTEGRSPSTEHKNGEQEWWKYIQNYFQNLDERYTDIDFKEVHINPQSVLK